MFALGLVLLAVGGPSLSPAEWRLGTVRHNDRYEIDVTVDAPGATFSIFLPCSCLHQQRLDDRRFRLTLFTQGLLGLHEYVVQVIVKRDERTDILRFPVAFEVTSRRPPREGPPDLLLRYRKQDIDLLRAFSEVSRALGGTEEVRVAEATELVERDRTTVGTAEVRRRLSEMGVYEAPEREAGTAGRRVLFYSSPDCPTCRWLRTHFFPPLEEQYGFSIDARSISDEENLRVLWGLLRKHGRQDFDAIAVLAGDRLFVGLDEIRNLLPRHLASGAPLSTAEGPERADLSAEFSAISVGAVAIAGLIDGINPCAFVTAVFLVSFLTVCGYRRGAAALVGAVYAGAVLVTYFALGLGLFAVARYVAPGDGLRYVVGGLAIVLAVLSLYDAARYAATGTGVTMQLPRGVKEKIHEVIRTRFRSGGVLAGAAVAGVLVTLLEAVCTGQIYLPTIVAMTRHSETAGRAVGLLAVYDLAFIVPLVAVLASTVAGVSSKRLADFSRRNVVVAKAAMAVLFLGLAAYLFA